MRLVHPNDYDELKELIYESPLQTKIFFRDESILSYQQLQHHPDYEFNQPEFPTLLNMEILEEGRIAYMSIFRMRTLNEHEWNINIRNAEDYDWERNAQNVYDAALFFNHTTMEHSLWMVFSYDTYDTSLPERFDNAIAMRDAVFPLPWRYRIQFQGEIWVLTDSETASAAEHATRFSKYTGFATIVGEQTRGVVGVPNFTRAFISLPNTGIVVQFDFALLMDEHGNIFEGYGVTPHHFNRPGMDALETTLALIAEGNY